MPALIVFTNEKLTDQEREQMTLDLTKIAAQIVGHPEAHILVAINDNASMAFGGKIQGKVVFMKLLGPVNRESEAKGAELVRNYFHPRGYEDPRIHIAYEFHDGTHWGMGGKLIR